MQASGGSFDRSSLNGFVVIVNIGMWGGVFRLKLGSWTSAVAHIATFYNMEADAALSKYACCCVWVRWFFFWFGIVRGVVVDNECL